jgi:Ran GTPase-activating protein 1
VSPTQAWALSPLRVFPPSLDLAPRFFIPTTQHNNYNENHFHNNNPNPAEQPHQASKLAIPETEAAMATGKVFSLEGKGLKLDTAEDIKPHIQDLVDNQDVDEVRFLGNTLGIGASEELAKALATKKKLQIANFADIFTGRLLSEIPPALQAILQALLKLPNLHTIDLSDNAFGLNTQAPLVAFLAEHTPLEHLYLNNNGLGPEAGTLIANALTKLAQKKADAGTAKPLRTIVCGRNRLENGSMAAWAKVYAAHSGVTHIKMVQNGIRQEGISLLVTEGLKHTTGLQLLDLQDNTFTHTGAKALSQVIGTWTSLQDLGVSDCLLGAKGGVYLGNALKAGNNKNIEVLRLQYNDITINGVKLLAELETAVPKLRRIELNGNKFNEEDICITKLRDSLDSRREDAGADEDDENWGLDELDELESEDEDESEDEEEEEEDEEEEEGKKESILKQADQAEAANVPAQKSEDVDKLAEILGKTGI